MARKGTIQNSIDRVVGSGSTAGANRTNANRVLKGIKARYPDAKIFQVVKGKYVYR
jgi:hypothetical protein